jgi:hypothetical protein
VAGFAPIDAIAEFILLQNAKRSFRREPKALFWRPRSPAQYAVMNPDDDGTPT